MNSRVALIAIMVEKGASVEGVNNLLHEYGENIIGRMGVPYRAKNVNIISIAIDAPQDVINTLAGQIGRLEGVSAKTVYASV
ncbi:MAG: iron-only hydrogenase system regulator [Firmicutes bacterium]|nr:iron-only hydrogenase system regulator [Bacillota bacterium]